MKEFNQFSGRRIVSDEATDAGGGGDDQKVADASVATQTSSESIDYADALRAAMSNLKKGNAVQIDAVEGKPQVVQTQKVAPLKKK